MLATGNDGSWAKAAEFIRVCGVMGGDSKLIRINIDHTGIESERGPYGEGSWMCLYSMWGLIRSADWEVKDYEETVMSDAREFAVAHLYILAENIRVDATKRISRQMMMIYGDEVVRGQGLTNNSYVDFCGAVTRWMSKWAQQSGHA